MAREPEAIAERRRILGERLATFRQAAGLTQAQLAQAMFCDRTQVAHVERGRSRADEKFWTVADERCQAGGALLAGFHELEAAKHDHEQRTRQREFADFQAKAERFRLEQPILLAPRTDVEVSQITTPLDKPWRVEAPTLEAMATILSSVRKLEDQTSSAAVMPQVRSLAHIGDVYALDARSHVRQQTLSLASELHSYMGWLLLNTKQSAQALQHFDTAIAQATEVDEPDHLSSAASFKGYLALKLGKPSAAATLSQVSRRDKRTFVALRAFDGYQAGHAYALEGDKRSAEKSLVMADRLLDAVPDAPPPPSWAYWYDVPFLLTQRAIAHEALGRVDLAMADLETGLAEMSEEHRNAEWGRELRERLAALQER